MDEHKTPEEIINDNAAPDAPETDAPEILQTLCEHTFIHH